MIERKLYFDQLEAFMDKQVIKVITGIRRSGKSVIMEQFAGHLAKTNPKSTIIYIKLDQMENEEFLEYHTLYAHIKDSLVPGQMNYIFIDEVQMCRDFQKPVESLFTMQDVDIYLTGSNTDVLSGELASLLSGRYITVHVQPFSFQEYRLCAKENNFPQQSTEEAFQDFFKFGGVRLVESGGGRQREFTEVGAAVDEIEVGTYLRMTGRETRGGLQEFV